MKTENKILSVFLAVLMLALAAPLAFGAETVSSGTCGDLIWTLDSEGTLTLSGEGSMYPESYDENEYCSPFEHSSEIKSVVIESGVTTISERAFNDCREIKSIIIPDTVTLIGEDAFHYNASLESITVSEDNPCYSAEDNVLFNKDKTELMLYSLGKPDTDYTVPNSVTTIDMYAFAGSSYLNTIQIPETVLFIGEQAFRSCYSLTAINVDENNPAYSSVDGVFFNKAQTELISFPREKRIDEYIVPDSVTRISSRSFCVCNGVKSIVIPDTVTEIGKEAFDNTYTIKTVRLPSNISSIDGVFRLCYSLKTIIIPSSVTNIGEDTFYDCFGLTSVIIPASVTSIGLSAFLYCDRLADVYYAGDEDAWNAMEIDEYNDELKNANIHFNFDVDSAVLHSVTYDYERNGGYWAAETVDFAWNSQTINLSLRASKYESEHEWEFIGWNTDPDAKEGLSSLTMGTEDVTLYAIFKDPFEEPTKNVYNLGEETYSFENYIDEHSYGHCHGMSMTSSGYYLGLLDPSTIGISSSQYLNTVPYNATSRNAICYFQHVQGNYTRAGVVAGSITYYHSGKTSEQCWNEVVNYVKSHQHDNNGDLQIQIWQTDKSGHAVNFLYYKNVNGQDRLYVYDNNFPAEELYFYLGSDAKIYEAPRSTYGTYVETICLVDVNKYYEAARSYNSRNYIFAKSGEVEISSATAYPMVGNEGAIMYEIPENLNQVTITPLVDNATFEYMDKAYSFEDVDEYTSGVLNVVHDDVMPGTAIDSIFSIVRNEPEQPLPGCPWCGKEHNGFFQKIVAFFHNILAKLFGNKY